MIFLQFSYKNILNYFFKALILQLLPMVKQVQEKPIQFLEIVIIKLMKKLVVLFNNL